MTLHISSPAFGEGERIPVEYTGDGADRSPPLEWAGVPEGAAGLALICDDPDAPGGDWVHWVVFNLPPSLSGLEAGIARTATLPGGAVQGTTDFDCTGYGGPAPPRGKPHRYYFKLYALSTSLDLPPGATKAQVLAAMNGRVLAEARCMGRYQR